MSPVVVGVMEVLLIEATGDMRFALPLMLTLVSAKFVGDRVGLGLYDQAIHARGYPFLEPDAPFAPGLHAGHVMNPRVKVVASPCTVGELVQALRPCEGVSPNVIAVLKSKEQPVMCGYALTCHLEAILLNRAFAPGGNNAGGIGVSASPNTLANPCAASRPGSPQSAERAVRVPGKVWSHASAHLGRYRRQIGSAATQCRQQLYAALEDAEAAPFEAGKAHTANASLLPWHVLNEHRAASALLPGSLYRRCLATLSSADMHCVVELAPYLFTTPITVSPVAPLRQAYVLFRTLGMRHLFVVGNQGQVAGLITRKSLTPEWIALVTLRLEEKADKD